MQEIWKDIEGYEGMYQVSNYGRVKSTERTVINTLGKVINKKERILKPYIGKDGYCKVTLYKNKKQVYPKIHRLVAEAFLPNPNNYPIINHKNPQEKDNNHVSNLEWCTYQYNAIYDNAHLKRGEKLKGRKNPQAVEFNKTTKSKLVGQFDKDMNLIATFPSVREAARQIGKLPSNIYPCCLGETKTAYGYIFKYL